MSNRSPLKKFIGTQRAQDPRIGKVPFYEEQPRATTAKMQVSDRPKLTSAEH